MFFGAHGGQAQSSFDRNSFFKKKSNHLQHQLAEPVKASWHLIPAVVEWLDQARKELPFFMLPWLRQRFS
jgi:hypothetical protein